MAIDYTDDAARIRDLLLRRLPAEAQADLEDRLTLESELRALADAIEEELFDDYARGRLKSEEAARFRTLYLSTEPGRSRLQFAQAFVNSEPIPTGVNRRHLLAAMVASLLVALGSFQLGRQSSSAQLIELRPGAVRNSGGPQLLRLRHSAPVIDIRLYPDEDSGSRALVVDSGERLVVSSHVFALPDGGRKLLVARELLHAGTYKIRLDQGERTTGTFILHVE